MGQLLRQSHLSNSSSQRRPLLLHVHIYASSHLFQFQSMQRSPDRSSRQACHPLWRGRSKWGDKALSTFYSHQYPPLSTSRTMDRCASHSLQHRSHPRQWFGDKGHSSRRVKRRRLRASSHRQGRSSLSVECGLI